LQTAVIIGRLVLRERISSTAIEEVLGDTSRATVVGGSKRSIEVWCKIDGCAVVFSCSEDTCYGDAYIGLCICFLLLGNFVHISNLLVDESIAGESVMDWISK